VTALAEAETFGWHLWQEAARRGVLEAAEVVVVGDGAHWIWNMADTHFPGATQILDWYHASTYVWEAASAIWGERHPQREAWAQRQLDLLWDGQVEQVLVELAQRQTAGEDVTAALTYYTTHRKRMAYAAYRARGLQIGSGSVESACKQLVSARLKQAGMIWDAPGAEAVATVRAWLQSGRWADAMALRPARGRAYQRQHAQHPHAGGVPEAAAARPGAAAADSAGSAVREGRGLPPEVLATIRAELGQDQGPHPWRHAWSVKRQREQHAANVPGTSTALAA